MNLVTMVIEPEQVSELASALGKLGVAAVTASAVVELGQGREHHEQYRAVAVDLDASAEWRLEVLVEDCQLEAALAVLSPGAHRDRGASGLTWTTPVEAVLDI